ncbi:hypothetical protein Leryth_006939 [Lithospermum erythrorhizon]|nr:hypothetical protein Leryth_006939 [Lithospermum erythrorhizon]
MSQDKSREFLHSGNAKDKFKFFYKATLLQRLEELLKDIDNQLDAAIEVVGQLEKSVRPVQLELEELEKKIKSLEQVEEISQHVQLIKKKLAWSWVYDIDRQLIEKKNLIEKLKKRIPACQKKIDEQNEEVKRWQDKLGEKRQHIDSIFSKTSEVRRQRADLEQSLSLAKKEKTQLEVEHERSTSYIQKIKKRGKSLAQHIHEIKAKHIMDTQDEESEMEEEIKKLEFEVDEAYSICQRLKEEEDAILETMTSLRGEIDGILKQIETIERRNSGIRADIHRLQMNMSNKVTVFGGSRVTSLLEAIERQHQRFRRPPIGPIGSHLTLVQGDMWAVALEGVFGKLLNAFIVTDHTDFLLLKQCAREANYNHLYIIIYDFSRPRLNIPHHMLPQTNHPTAISVVHSDNHIILNVLIDMGHGERQVLVKDYDTGKQVAFDQRVSNLNSVFTSDGFKMFSRGSAQTILPPSKNARVGRLSGSFGNQIEDLEQEALQVQKQLQFLRGKKRSEEETFASLQHKSTSMKRKRQDAERECSSKKLKLDGMKRSFASESKSTPTSTADELHRDLSKVQEEINEKEISLENLELKLVEANSKVDNLKAIITDLCNSTKEDLNSLKEAEEELGQMEAEKNSAEMSKKHYETMMSTKVLSEIESAEEYLRKLEEKRKEDCKKASIICAESELDALGDDEVDPEKLSAKLRNLNQRLERETQRFSESIDELRMQYEKKLRKISKKQQTYKAFREKLDALKKALDNRTDKFQRNASHSKRQLTWKFNGHLSKKGISGRTKVSYEDQTLSVEVKMPQDASSGSVRDTRGLSGGERSFSTLCFALALHEMIEAPFRAMDEFDVFMDAVSRKISLDTLVDFALAQGSQWIFITPHDISMVKHDERIKKQQMAAPRG